MKQYSIENSNGKILSLQALRALAFLGIFLNHAGAPSFKWPAFGVSIFYVLSGYLMYYHYENRDMACSIRENALFSWNKIKKLYPLHILTMCFAVILDLAIIFSHGIDTLSILGLLAKIGLNITLLQTWVPYSDINVCLNGVAWYLSVSVFLYFMFPYLRNLIKRLEIKALVLVCTSVLLAEILLCVPWIVTLGSDSKVYIWFMYCFPVFRLGDFFIGCCIGRCFKTENIKSCSLTKITIIEIAATLLTVLVHKLVNKGFTNPFLIAAKNWTTPYIPLAVIWIVLFTLNKGLITRLLTNKVTVFIGNISPYIFLIHYVFTQYIGSAINYLELNITYLQRVVIICVELLLSIAASVIYDKYIKRIIYDWYKAKRSVS